jgi:hypothetical protein
MALLKALQDLLQPEIERISAFGNNSVAPVQAGALQGRPMQTLPDIGRAPYEQQNGFEPMQPGGGRFVTEDNATFYDGQGFSPKPEEPWYKRMADDPALMDRLAMGFNTMRLDPDQGLQAVLADRIKTAGALARGEKSKNKTLVALQNMGLDQSEVDLLGENPELLKVAATAMYKTKMGGDVTAEMKTWQSYMDKLGTDEQRADALLVKLGLKPRAGLPLETYFGRGYAGASGTAAGATEAEYAKQATTNRILKSQLDFGFDNLGTALGATGQTGKIFGNLPAVTTGAQLADNAKAILLPLMKGVWRGAGEGVFTDKDQETLERMFPSRDMTPEAAKQALLIVRQLTELKLQNPTFDINMYGNALRNRGAPTAPAAPAVATPTPAVSAPAAAPAPSVRDEADAILRGDN